MPALGHDDGAAVGVVAKEEKEGKKAKDAKEDRFSYPIPTIEEATAVGHGGPDDWDDVIAGYESGSTDVGSEEVTSGAAAEFWFKTKEKVDDPLLPQKLLCSQCFALTPLKLCISASSTSNGVSIMDKKVDLLSYHYLCLPQPHHRPGSWFMFAFIPPSPPSKTMEKEDKLDTFVLTSSNLAEKPRHKSRARISVVLPFHLDDRPQRVYAAALLGILVMYRHSIHHYSTRTTSPPSSAYLPDHSMVQQD
ncbi:hypothetical protein CVT25_012147 [Psilocybe cyanescens]|uniref:Uncharacterized protein n=1 Tax=Psilocybe cyanescens TaxID=93625 RepID=A0A409XH41_PSICY|nr:hypothetical protein CVT25_012147 [Psilocybe cyanescens]